MVGKRDRASVSLLFLNGPTMLKKILSTMFLQTNLNYLIVLFPVAFKTLWLLVDFNILKHTLFLPLNFKIVCCDTKSSLRFKHVIRSLTSRGWETGIYVQVIRWHKQSGFNLWSVLIVTKRDLLFLWNWLTISLHLELIKSLRPHQLLFAARSLWSEKSRLAQLLLHNIASMFCKLWLR